MKKLLVVSALLTALVSCSATSTPSDYTSLYNANAKAEIAKMHESYKAMYGAAQTAEGKLTSSAIVLTEGTETGSISLNSDYSAFTNNGLSQVSFNNPEMKLIGTMSGANTTQSIKFSNVSLIAGGFVNLLKMESPAFVVDSPNAEVKAHQENQVKESLDKLAKYSGKWIDMNSADAESEKIFAKLSQMSVADVEKYVTTYPIFTATGTATQNGTKYTFPIEFNKTNVANLIEAAGKDITGSGMTDSDKQNLLNTLSTIKFENTTITYDTKDPLFSDFKATLLNPQEANQKIALAASRNGGEYKLDATVNNGGKDLGKFALVSTSNGKNSDFTANLTADMGDGTQANVANLTGKIEDNILKTMKGTLAAVVATGNLEYTHKDKFAVTASANGTELINISNQFSGDNFAGKALLQGAEIAKWNAEINSKKLQKLAIVIQDITTGKPAEKPLLDLALAPQSGSEMLVGTAKMASNGKDMASAKVQLQVEGSEKFGLIVDEITATDATTSAAIPLKKFDVFVNQKVSNATKTITLPTETIPLYQVEKDLGMTPSASLPSVLETSATNATTATGTTKIDTAGADDAKDITPEAVPTAPMYPTEPLNK